MADQQGGTKLDNGKVRYDLLPPEFLHATATILTFGATKYAARNWEKGIAYGRVFGALQRHLWAWWRGEDQDPETGKSHLWHASCCLAFLTTYEARGMSGFDDRPHAQARDNVLPVSSPAHVTAGVPDEAPQHVPERPGGFVVQRPLRRFVGGVEVPPRTAEALFDIGEGCAYTAAGGVAP